MRNGFLLFAVTGALLSLCAAGCGGHDDDEAQVAPAEGPALFEKNKGVLLPADMKRDLGIQTAELAERSLTQATERVAQVYRVAAPGRPGSAVLQLETTDATALATGQPVRLHVAAKPAQIITGEVSRLESLPAGRLEAIIVWTELTPEWTTGQFVTALLASTRTNNAATVPASAVIDGATGPFVYAASGEHFVRTPVKLGASGDGWKEITEGLYPGDVVVAAGAETLWMIELCALKGGAPCCPVPLRKGRE